jgi:hypothetical protein
MSKAADSIRRGLEQAVAYAKGEADLRVYRVHVPGEAGVDVYRGMIMALCKLICRSDDDPTVIDRRLAASHAHMLEARQILAGAANG